MIVDRDDPVTLCDLEPKPLADVEPLVGERDRWLNADEQLAFYLNAYNAIVVHQVVLHYPITSIRQIAHAFVRPYPVGSRNLSLHLLHAQLLRAFGDPRIHGHSPWRHAVAPPCTLLAALTSRRRWMQPSGLKGQHDIPRVPRLWKPQAPLRRIFQNGGVGGGRLLPSYKGMHRNRAEVRICTP